MLLQSHEPPPPLKQPLPREQASDVLEEALERGKLFTEPFQSLVRATDLSTVMVFNAMDKPPFPHTRENQKDMSVVFIGDSNHAMSPFAENGANMALMDGLELAEQICQSDSLEAALSAYDASSMGRSKSAIQMSHWSIAMAHAQGWKLAFHMLCLKIIRFLMF